MSMPLCAVCLCRAMSTPASLFSREKEYRNGEFIPGKIEPLCTYCQNRRLEMKGRPDLCEVPWEEGLAEWQIWQIHES
jgi:hypothetical protein